MVVVRDIENPLFEEALFIVRPHTNGKERESDLLTAAHKLIRSGASSGKSVGNMLFQAKKPVLAQKPYDSRNKNERLVRDVVMVCVGFAACLVFLLCAKWAGLL